MIAASGKWMGSSGAVQPMAGVTAPGVAGLLGMGESPTVAGCGSFADAMEQSVAGAGKDGYGSGANIAKPTVSDAVGMEAAAGKVAVGKTPVAGMPLAKGGSAGISVKTAQRSERGDDSGADVSAETEEEAVSAGVTPKGSAPVAMVAVTATGSDEADIAHANDGDGLTAVVAPVKTADAAKAATIDTKKPKPRGEAKAKEQDGKSHTASVSGRAVSSVAVSSGAVSSGAVSAGGGAVSPVSASAAAVQSVVKTPIAGRASATLNLAGKTKSMRTAAPAVVNDGKAPVPVSAVTKDLVGAGADGAVDAKVAAAGRGAVDATESPSANVPSPPSVPMTVAVVAQGHSLNLLQGTNVTVTSHTAAVVSAAASLQGAASNELKLTTMETAKPNQLEVGLRGGEFGWLKVRAELGTNGEVNAFLRGATVGSTEALQVQAPKIAAYLGANDVAVRGVHVEAAQSDGGSASVGFAGGNGSGSAAQQQSFGGGRKSSAGTAASGEDAADVEGGNEVVVPVELVSGRSVVSLTGTGNWLSVRA
jgi:hypothetical protein